MDKGTVASGGTVSVIIPCFNQGRFLGDTIRSLKNQTYHNWEAIIVNDGSTDNTHEIAAQLCSDDARIKYIYKENNGVSAARNAAIAMCFGEYIQFLDADDQIDESKLEKQVSILENQAHIGIVYGNARYFHDGAFGQFNSGPYGAGPEHDWIAEAWDDLRPMLVKLVEKNLLPVCSPLLRRSVVNAVGPFNEELVGVEDWEYWIRCAAFDVQFLFVCASGTDAFIRIHPSSATQNVERMQLACGLKRQICHEYLTLREARFANLVRLLPCLKDLPPRERSRQYERIAKGCRSIGEYLLVASSRAFAIGGPLHVVARYVGLLLPESVLHRFVTLGLRF